MNGKKAKRISKVSKELHPSATATPLYEAGHVQKKPIHDGKMNIVGTYTTATALLIGGHKFIKRLMKKRYSEKLQDKGMHSANLKRKRIKVSGFGSRKGLNSIVSRGQQCPKPIYGAVPSRTDIPFVAPKQAW